MMLTVKKAVRMVSDAFFSAAYKKECSVCAKKVKNFEPLSSYYKNQAALYNFPFSADEAETLNYKEYTCPYCGASDRDRLYALYIQQNTNPEKQYKLLDIAPAPALRNFLKRKNNITYRSADLLQNDVDDTGVDIMNMKIYADKSFDIFICSHVLEHVESDIQAMRELNRILTDKGFGIAMVPIILTVNIIDEDPGLTDDSERWRRFGQQDHVRLYSKNGFTERLEKSGFKVNEYNIEYFGSEKFKKFGIDNKSVLYIVTKLSND